MRATNSSVTSVAGVSFVAAVMLGAAPTLGCGEPELSSERTDRQTSVAEAGTTVMPFDLEKTTHVFETTESGGLQQVVSDSDDAEQVKLIREHLSEEAERFARGDFHDPEMIHGEDMAGLHELVGGHERISIEYSKIDRGAQILYTTEDPELVVAIHAWFSVQLRDHGDHAQPDR